MLKIVKKKINDIKSHKKFLIKDLNIKLKCNSISATEFIKKRTEIENDASRQIEESI